MTSQDPSTRPDDSPEEEGLEQRPDYATRRLNSDELIDASTSPAEPPPPDATTRRIEPDLLFGEPPKPEAPIPDAATRRLEDDELMSAPAPDTTTRRIDPNELFSALEPEPEPPASANPPAGPTQFIDEPVSSVSASAFSLPESQPAGSSELPPPSPPPQMPASGIPRMELPPTPPPVPGQAPLPPAGAKKDNTLMIVAIIGVVVVALCAICACLAALPFLFAAGSGGF
jgi:hypothetical protein